MTRLDSQDILQERHLADVFIYMQVYQPLCERYAVLEASLTAI